MAGIPVTLVDAAAETGLAQCALAVAVFDHGDAPPGYSDRKFRFDYLRQQAARGERDVRSLSYKGHEAPESMTRMAAVVRTAGPDTPILVTDTAVAGVIGALEDRRVAAALLPIP